MNSTALFESLGPISKTRVEALSWLFATQIRNIPKYKKKSQNV